MPIKHLVIRGRVQGVGFRYSMFAAAQTMGIKGWVRNRRDGTVEAMAQASDKELESFVEWARRGPRTAEVDEVIVEEGNGEFHDFQIRETL